MDGEQAPRSLLNCLFLVETCDVVLCGIWRFTGFVLFVSQGFKVRVLISWAVTHSSKNFWRPTILSVICCALFRLKKGFLGGRSGSFVLRWEKKKYSEYSAEQTGAEFAIFIFF